MATKLRVRGGLWKKAVCVRARLAGQREVLRKGATPWVLPRRVPGRCLYSVYFWPSVFGLVAGGGVGYFAAKNSGVMAVASFLVMGGALAIWSGYQQESPGAAQLLSNELSDVTMPFLLSAVVGGVVMAWLAGDH